mgnify:CR=1 FL=1
MIGPLAQDEIGARLSDETNRNVNALAVMTTLFLPPTLVTGIFGMNTSDLPLTISRHGSLWAIGLASAAAGGAYWVLRRMGIIRR